MHQEVFEVSGAVRDNTVFFFLPPENIIQLYYLSLTEYNTFFYLTGWEKNRADCRLS